MIKVIKTTAVTLDADKAIDLLKKYNYQDQRRLRRNRVEFYAEEMLDGKFDPTTQLKVAFCPDGAGIIVGRLIDGQHRLHALAAIDAEIDFVMTYVSCDTMDEVARLYYIADQGLARTPSDMYAALHLSDRYQLSERQIDKIGAAVQFIASGFIHNTGGLRATRSRDVRLSNIERYIESAQDFFKTAGVIPKPIESAILRASTLGVGLVTFEYSSNVIGTEKVERFWSGVIFDDGLRIGDPRKTAHTHLISSRMNSGSGSRTPGGLKSVSAAYSARYVANCFGAWVDGRSIQFSQVPDASAPIRIAGSPYNGR